MYESKIRSEATDLLVRAFLSLENEEECYRFLEDICTYKELTDMAQRMQVAQMLKNRETYSEIVQETGMSTATISRVNRAMTYGAGGYNVVLQHLNKTEEEEQPQ